jgi:hypothetical protein
LTLNCSHYTYHKAQTIDIKNARRAVTIEYELEHIEHKIKALRNSKTHLQITYTAPRKNDKTSVARIDLSLTDSALKAVTQNVIDDLIYQKAKLVDELQKLGFTHTN